MAALEGITPLAVENELVKQVEQQHLIKYVGTFVPLMSVLGDTQRRVCCSQVLPLVHTLHSDPKAQKDAMSILLELLRRSSRIGT